MKAFTQTNEKLISTSFLILRIGLGAVMFAHGSQKAIGIFGGKGLDATATGMSGMLGIPVFMAYLSIFTEFLGGIGLMVGGLTRFFGVAVFINMMVAVLAVHAKNGFFAPTGFEYPATLAIIALAITIAGPGLYSLDNLLFGDKRVTSEMLRKSVSTGSNFKPASRVA